MKLLTRNIDKPIYQKHYLPVNKYITYHGIYIQVVGQTVFLTPHKLLRTLTTPMTWRF